MNTAKTMQEMTLRNSAVRLVGAGAIFFAVVLLAFAAQPEPWLFAALSALVGAVLFARAARGGTLDACELLFVSLAAVIFLVPNLRDDLGRLVEGKVRVWNVYHYYLGSKYFEELGYDDLYLATLKADREGVNYWTDVVTVVRDLRTYEVVDVEAVVAAYEPRGHFTPERWKMFKSDVAAFAPHRSAKGWRGIFRDRGYNPPPVWTAIGGFFSDIIEPDRVGLTIIASMDILLLFAMAAAVFWAFGPVPALLVAIVFVAGPMNIPRALGGFLQFDWLASIVVGFCLMKRGMMIWAGIALSYALMTRVFPMFMIGAFFIPLLVHMLREKTIHADGQRFLAGGLIGVLLLLAASLVPSHGWAAWQDFLSAIFTHSGDHVLGERRIGLEHIFTAGPDLFGETIEKATRAALLEDRSPLYWASCAIILSAFLFVAVRSSPSEAFALGTIVAFSLLVLSRYYYGILLLMPLMARTQKGAIFIAALQLAVFAVAYGLRSMGAELHMQYVAINVGLTLYFACLLVARMAAPPRKAWKRRNGHNRELLPSSWDPKS